MEVRLRRAVMLLAVTALGAGCGPMDEEAELAALDADLVGDDVGSTNQGLATPSLSLIAIQASGTNQSCGGLGIVNGRAGDRLKWYHLGTNTYLYLNERILAVDLPTTAFCYLPRGKNVVNYIRVNTVTG